MFTRDRRVVGQQRSELAFAEQSRELAAMPCPPRCLPVPEENSGMGLDREPAVRCGHGPVLADPQMLGHKGDLVGLVTDMFHHGVGHDQVERVFSEGQMPAVGDHEVVPAHRVLCSPVETVEQNAARHEKVDGASHAVGDDVFERLILLGLDTDNQDAAGTDALNYLFEPVSFTVAVVDAESAGRSFDEIAHSRSLWQAKGRKPIVTALFGLLFMLAAGCSSGSTDETSLQDAPEAQPQVESAPLPAEPGTITDQATTDDSTDESTDDSDDVDAESSSDGRGSRVGADEADATLDAPTATPTSAPAPEAETVADDTNDEQTATPTEEPTATPVATTAPLPTPEPSATAPTPVPSTSVPSTLVPPTPVPTATQVPVPTQDGDPVFVPAAPTGPVPSDEIVVQGPTVDEAESAVISANGAAACARAESAIDLLDRGDSQGTAAALVEASQFATQASESDIAATASQLADAGTDEGAAIAAIIATLNACAQHGYQV